METRCYPSGPATHKGVTSTPDHCTVSCISAIYLETSGNLVKALIIGSEGFSPQEFILCLESAPSLDVKPESYDICWQASSTPPHPLPRKLPHH